MHAMDATTASAVSCVAIPATAIASVGIHSSGANAIRYGNGRWPSQPTGISLNAIHTTHTSNTIHSAIAMQTPLARP